MISLWPSLLLTGPFDARRDDLLTEDDISNMQRSLEQLQYKLDTTDAQSVHLSKCANEDLVVHYQQYRPGVRWFGQKDQPFILSIQTAFGQEMLLKHGHRSAVSIDATFGTNLYKVIPTCVSLLLCDTCS
ncbi:hypothetical protein WJX73_003213 [Symbiochloris irregularis]|uniref:Uncharacterized protein n=1 Tax=Symbiochloris irregularis TaxID=706552 RepID=A0AAW1NVN5_9CHLO